MVRLSAIRAEENAHGKAERKDEGHRRNVGDTNIRHCERLSAAETAREANNSTRRKEHEHICTGTSVDNGFTFTLLFLQYRMHIFSYKLLMCYYVKITFDDIERCILVKLLYEKRNELIREGRYTDAIDELILKDN